MATTAGYVYPIKPVGGAGGTLAADIMTIPSDPSQVWKDGDIVTIDGTTKDAVMDNSDPAANLVFGVFAGKAFTANATIDRDGEVGEDLVQVYPAWPGRRFAANLTTNETTDETGVYQSNLRVAAGNNIVESDSDTTACVSIETDVPIVYVIEYVSPQSGYNVTNSVATTQFGRSAGVGMRNPRITFMFMVTETVFGLA